MIKKTLMAAAVLSVAGYVHAGAMEELASTGFATEIPSASRNAVVLDAEKVQAPAYAESSVKAETPVLSDSNLFARTGKQMLFAFHDTEAQHKAFVSWWNGVLKTAGIETTGAAWDKTMTTLSYNAGGKVIREFISDDLAYDGNSEAAISESMRFMEARLQESGMNVIADFRLKFDFLRPSYALYYLTSPAENQDRETQLRVLKPGEDIDYDILSKAGVNVVRKENEFTAAYIGPMLTVLYKGSKSEEGINKKLAETVAYLTEAGKKVIGTRIIKLEPNSVGLTHEARIYFYQ